MGVAFDNLNFVKRLEHGGGFTRPQAATLSEAFHDAVVESVATKQDLGEVRQEIVTLRSEMKVGFSELKTNIAESKVWAVSAAATVIAVLSAIKYFG